MDSTRPSRSALDVAIHRAAHQLLDTPRIFDDPLAMAILGHNGAAIIRNNLQQLRASPELRAFISVRSRYAEDRLAAAFKRGVRQYVVLGAGLDTFAYRNPYADRALHVYEVDIPSTQQWKHQLLGTAEITLPESLTFVGVDFENQVLPDRLRECGFDFGKPAIFSFLGIVVFLEEATVKGTLAFVASLPASSEVVFDYGVVDELLNEQQRQLRELTARQLAALGEPLLTFFEPQKLADDLKKMGYVRVEDLGSAEINKRYFAARADGLNVGIGSRRLICACR